MIKKSIHCIVIMLLLQCSYGVQYYDYHDYDMEQPIVINERIGETIDPEERRQFDLFPGIENFTSATFYGPSTIGYAVEIVTENKKYISTNRDPMAVEILSDYIKHYEEIEVDRKPFEGRWQIVAYDAIGFPITQTEVNSECNESAGCVTGGVAGGCLGFFPSLLIGLAYGRRKTDILEEEFDTIMTITLAGSAIFAVGGAALGKEIVKNNALESIKDSRRLRTIK
jgi:hypothetical protein